MTLFDDLEQHVTQSRPRFEEWLGRLVDIPTVSMDPARRQDVRRGAEVAAEYLRTLGAQTTMIETGGHPMVVGGWVRDPAWPTVVVYNHIDVQPAMEPEWTREPFKFSVEGELYYGRGATDDKGPALTALLAAHYAVEHDVPLNVQFLWELEEEMGSPHFAAGLAKTSSLLRKPDSVVVSDTIWLAGGRPAAPYGLRGNLAARLILETAKREAHSGLTGGVARNPLTELAAVLTACVDAKSGRVTIPSFYRSVKPLKQADRAQFLKSGFQVTTFAAAHQLTKLRTRNRAQVMRRLWAEPTFEVHGIVGGYTGPGVKTSIPPRAEAKVSMRLVPDQDPVAMFTLFRRYVRTLNPDVRVEADGMLRPYVADLGGPYAEALRKALRFGFGKDPAFIREGGSIPVCASFETILGLPVVLAGFTNPDDNAHAPNESMILDNYERGIRAIARMWDEIAATDLRA